MTIDNTAGLESKLDALKGTVEEILAAMRDRTIRH